jgi:hypothetical protein
MSAPKLLCHWSFDTTLAGPAFEMLSQSIDKHHGPIQLVPGILRHGLRFDGFTNWIERPKEKKLGLTSAVTAEAWVTLGNFPWNRAPITDAAEAQSKGYGLYIDDAGCAVMAARLGDQWVEAKSESLGLKTWHHVTGTATSGEGVKIYINGKLKAHTEAKGAFVPSGDMVVFIGRSRDQMVGTGGIRPYAHLPAYMYLDACLDEIKIYDGTKSAEGIAADFAALTPPPPAPLPERKLPSGPEGKGRFGAYYTHLKYYDAWDRRWRVGDHPDVVVRFDEEAYRLVFWRGTNYIPCWATENGIWYTNEFNETWGFGAIGCAEPMSDKHCVHSHVRIIETNDARCVIHWRYALVDVFGVRPRADPVTKWTDWTDELYTIYPDGTGTRKITLNSTQPLDAHEFQETIVVLQPGQRPEDVIEPEALTMANMSGEEHVYTWVGGCPKVIDKPDRCNIQRVNIKSDTKPFAIVSDKHCLKRDLSKSDRPVFPVYREEIRPPQLFPWWNHWPTADLPSDGRYAVSSDRAAHSSLLTGMEWEDYEVTPTSRTRVMMHGLTRHEAGELAHLGKSWLQAPGLRIDSQGFAHPRYDILERAYVVDAIDDKATSLVTVIEANSEHPIHNICLVVTNWGQGVNLDIDGQTQNAGSDFRQGIRDTFNGRDLVIWIKLKRDSAVTLTLTPQSAPKALDSSPAKANSKGGSK